MYGKSRSAQDILFPAVRSAAGMHVTWECLKKGEPLNPKPSGWGLGIQTLNPKPSGLGLRLEPLNPLAGDWASNWLYARSNTRTRAKVENNASSEQSRRPPRVQVPLNLGSL